MRGLFDGYRKMEESGEVWFAGANTDSGFKGCYPDFADERKLERLYIIKGGPGSGKSTMMKRLADEAERRGYPVARYLCGSDPDSLDAVVLDGRIVMLDGTPPHAVESGAPGSVGELVDVSRFWNSGKLEKRRKEIEALAALKAADYAAGTRWLAAADAVVREELHRAEELFLREKAEKTARRLIERLGKPEKNGGGIRYRYDHAVTMRGRAALSTVGRGTARRFVIEDACGTAALFLDLLAREIEKAGFAAEFGLLPLGRRIAGIRVKDAAFYVGTPGDGDAVIRTRRFVSGAPRGPLRLASKVRESCLSAADDALRSAAEHHFALEEIYKDAMDFDALHEAEDTLRNSIMDRLAR